MNEWKKMLTFILPPILIIILVAVWYRELAFAYAFEISGRYCLVFLCVLIMICTFVVLGRIKALESKIEALAGERNKPETGEPESDRNS